MRADILSAAAAAICPTFFEVCMSLRNHYLQHFEQWHLFEEEAAVAALAVREVALVEASEVVAEEVAEEADEVVVVERAIVAAAEMLAVE